MEFDAMKVLGPPGWVELRIHGDDAPRVLVKYEDRGGRGVATRVVIVGELDPATLRSLPLARIDAAVNHPQWGFARGVVEPLDPEVERDMEQRGHLPVTPVRALDDAVSAYLDAEPTAASGVVTRRRERQREPLSRPDGTDPDGFLRRVAAAYSDAAMRTSAPAKVLAEEAGVPVGTVHRWVRDARQRGHLPPARKGRAG